MSFREKTESVKLPDFWPDKDTMTDSSTLNIEWASQEQINGTQSLVQSHLYYNSYAGVRIHGIYVRPASIPEGTTIPGMILVHGGGYNHEQVYPLGKYLAEILGFGILCIDSPGVSSGNWSSSGYPETASSCTNVTGLDGPRGSFYYHNVIALLRGVTVLQSLPEINASLVGLGGFSGGGIASLIANGVESKYQRLKFSVHMAVAGQWTEDFPGKSPVDWYILERGSEKCRIFLESFDPINYAALAHAPALMVDITNDQFFDLEQIRQTFKALPESKANALSIHVNLDHWFLKYSKFWEPVKEWCQIIVRGEDPIPIPEIDRATKKNNSISITVKQAFDPRIDAISMISNVKDLRNVYDWNSTEQPVQEGQATYTWKLDSVSTDEYAFYLAVISNDVLLFTSLPVFNDELKTSEWSVSGILAALALIPAKIKHGWKKKLDE
ncbi:MAG: acetylxylan esterase [Candidatus Odinarchaeota archaeon]